MIIDTNVLIWLERETRKGVPGAATALAHELPPATGNVKEFERVRGLRVVGV